MVGVIIGLIVVAGAAFGVGYWLRVLQGRQSLSSAELKAKQLLEEAGRQAEATRKQAQLDSKEQLHALRQEFEEKTKDRRNELSHMEKRLHQREELLDRKLDLLDRKEKDLGERDRQLVGREHTLKAKDEQLGGLIAEEKEKLKTIAGLNTDQAKQLLLSRLEQDCRSEAGSVIKQVVG